MKTCLLSKLAIYNTKEIRFPKKGALRLAYLETGRYGLDMLFPFGWLRQYAK